MNPEHVAVINMILIIVILFFAVMFLAGLVIKLSAFSRELDCLKREIARTKGAEREYWKREKRRLWLSLLPFFRR